ncbi:hypothetical protein [Clostridiisalibacter paucivorans]|uniref:hypothetical protein n=1 Tax=Clostridiisalibacter paucivorans TaxID=408753 RepID=UPI0006848435|nr:hypothetical protein [Clostridiisalibacter paucivorans]
MTYKRFFYSFLILTIGFILGIVAINYIIDPLQFYRKASFYQPVFSEEQRYQNPALAKTYDYDTVIIGTSMTENFMSSYVDQKFGGNTLKLSISGGSAREQYLIANKAIETGKVKRVIWCLEYSAFRGDAHRVRNDYGSFPYYLYDNNPVNDIRYLLNKDTLMTGLKGIFVQNALKPKALETLNNWESVATYGEDKVISSFKQFKADKNFPFKEFKLQDIKDSIDENLLPIIDKNDDIEFFVYYPPYSILRYRFFYESDPQLFYNELEMKRYIFDKTKGYENINIYDFQDVKEITFDFENYKDISHHSQQINEYIIDAIVEGKHRVTEQNLDKKLNNLNKQLNESYRFAPKDFQ